MTDELGAGEADAPPAQADADVPDWEVDPGELAGPAPQSPDGTGAPRGRMGAGSVVALVLITVAIGAFVLWVLMARGPQETPVDRLRQPSRPLPSGPAPAELATGAALFEANCAECHGPGGEGGEGREGPSLRTRGLGPNSLEESVLVGFVQNGGGDMEGFRGRLSIEQTAQIVAYVRWLQGFGPDSPEPGPDD